MDLHLRIETEPTTTIEIDVHLDKDRESAQLTCRRFAYEEVGGEAFNANRRRWRCALSPDQIARLRQLLPEAALPVPREPAAGLDGTTFFLVIGRGASAQEYRWWGDPPLQWTALGQIVKLLLEATEKSGTE